MKNIIKSIIIIGAGCLFLSSCMIAKPSKEETKRSITVNGSGRVSVIPDLVKLNFIIKTYDWNVSKAVERNAANTDFVIKALRESGVDSNDISTRDYSIRQDTSRDIPGQYTVINNIAVIIRNTEITGKVIDSAVKSNIGANGLTSFEYAVSDNSSALRQARTLAIQDAQDAASLLAGASGCKVSKVISISENYSSAGSATSVKLERAMNSTSILPAEVTVTSNVTITYELEN